MGLEVKSKMVSVNMHDSASQVMFDLYDLDDDTTDPHDKRTYILSMKNENGEIRIFFKGLSRAIEVVTDLREDLVVLRERAAK